MIAAEQNFRGANCSSIFRARIVRMVKQFLLKRVFQRGLFVTQNTGDKTQNGINDDSSCNFPAGEDKVTNRDLRIYVFINKALINAFVTSAPQGEARLARKFCGKRMVEGAALRAEIDMQRFITARIDSLSDTRQRFVLHDHAGTTAERTVINALMAVITVFTRVPVMQGSRRILFFLQGTTDNTLAEPVANKLRKDTDDINMHGFNGRLRSLATIVVPNPLASRHLPDRYSRYSADG